MDTLPGRPAQPVALETAAIRADFQAQLQALRDAAKNWGLQPDHPEGVFISTMIGTQAGFADLAISLSEALHAIVLEARAIAGEELARQRVATAETKDATAKAWKATEGLEQAVREAIAKIETEKQAVVATLPDRMAIEMIRATRGELLSRYALLKTTIQWGASLGIGAVMVAMVIFGYAWGTWSDWGMTSRIEAVGAAVERCQVLPKWRDDKGHPLCEVSEFVGK